MTTLTDKVEAIEKSAHSWRGYIKGAAAVSVVLAAVVGWWVSQELMPAIHTMQGTLTIHTDALRKVNDAVKVLSDQQSEATQKLIRDLLTAATTTTDTTVATRAVEAASTLTATLRHERRSASSEFFQAAVESIGVLGKSRQPNLHAVAFEARQQLAEYRSALQPQPELPNTHASQNTVAIQAAINAFIGPRQTEAHVAFQSKIYEVSPPLYMRSNVGLVGEGYAALRASSADRDMLVPPAITTTTPAIRGISFIDGSQSLDGFVWGNVTFINMHIRYSGGTVQLHNVRFVNCTLDLPSDSRGTSIADYVALGRTDELRIG